ncbi:isoamyl acetate-hydrolyzing esterase [Coemansia biformis]|uniref:Isoamyl acetate-hydrolyzing esterase n=1 Tax=Coemansia biformis TaxID=1286918 RepID=A0A9W7YCL3_9FUNG|nr:isoamyl acetate-hydrolyzing esterase [Coemansia biformis]
MQLCILFFGANDAVLPSSRLHNPIDSYAENLKYFIALLRDPSSKYYSPNTRIMIITPPAVSDAMTKESAKGQSVFKYVSRAATKQYADMAIVVAKEANIPFVDLNTAIDKKVEELVATIKDPGVYAGYDRFLADGLHLTARGYEVLYNLIIDTIRTNWPEIMPGPPLKATVLNPKVNQ